MDRSVWNVTRLQQLQAYLAAGWQIEAPVLERSALHGRAGATRVLEVILRAGEHRNLLALPADPAVEQFIREQQIAVVDVF